MSVLEVDILDAHREVKTIDTIGALIAALADAAPMYRIAGAAMTRPANQTPYDIDDSISNNATAGGVLPNVAALAFAADKPFTVEAIRLSTNDTGPAAADAYVEMMLFDADPTAGVIGGDNALYQQNIANLVGVFAGTFESDVGYFTGGSTALLVPARGSVRHIMLPASGTVNIWWQLKTLSAFTPSANSTIWTPKFEGFRGRV